MRTRPTIVGVRVPRRMPGFRWLPGVAVFAVAIWMASGRGVAVAPPPAGALQFVFTSDAHYGITRAHFRGGVDVAADVVNAALVTAINSLPATVVPGDGGVGSGQAVGAVDFVAEGGDIANREESLETGDIQPAAVSWEAFERDYARGLSLTDRTGRRSALLVVPGNHDVSNAVGFYRPMQPGVDRTAMVSIFNRYMEPAVPLTSATYEYASGRVRYTRDIGGIHFVFLTIWPDSDTRTWMETDLARLDSRTPVVIVTHDQPDAEAKHFTNPNGYHDINATDRFENLLRDELADGTTIDVEPRVEQLALERFLHRHPNITAYFHGNSNWNQFYDWTGPSHSVALHTFRVDSPMKGAFSAQDETKLSFQLVTVDTEARLMTVRECLWNTDAPHVQPRIVWGSSTTVALSPRP